jgi:polysaccharide export outer membrane protein
MSKSRLFFILLSLIFMPLAAVAQPAASSAEYRISAGDNLQIFVWKNPDLSVTIPVRPDGKISTPLAPDVQAQGQTTSQLAASLKAVLSRYVQDPVVTVMVRDFAGAGASDVRVIGQAVTPKAVPYRSGLTALDVMVAVGGLSNFAAGNRAELTRTATGRTTTIPLRLADLLRSGDMSANVVLMPGDVIRIPERWF